MCSLERLQARTEQDLANVVATFIQTAHLLGITAEELAKRSAWVVADAQSPAVCAALQFGNVPQVPGGLLMFAVRRAELVNVPGVPVVVTMRRPPPGCFYLLCRAGAANGSGVADRWSLVEFTAPKGRRQCRSI